MYIYLPGSLDKSLRLVIPTWNLYESYLQASRKNFVALTLRYGRVSRQFKYLGTTVTNQNLIQEEIKRRLNSDSRNGPREIGYVRQNRFLFDRLPDKRTDTLFYIYRLYNIYYINYMENIFIFGIMKIVSCN
jgi:hypothetical protein